MTGVEHTPCPPPVSHAWQVHPYVLPCTEARTLNPLPADETKEYLKDPDDPYRLLDETRTLGLTVCRGTSVMLVCPSEGFEEISNPFLQEEGEE